MAYTVDQPTGLTTDGNNFKIAVYIGELYQRCLL